MTAAPRSYSAIVFLVRPSRSASCSCVSPWSFRYFLSTFPSSTPSDDFCRVDIALNYPSDKDWKSRNQAHVSRVSEACAHRIQSGSPGFGCVSAHPTDQTTLASSPLTSHPRRLAYPLRSRQSHRPLDPQPSPTPRTRSFCK